MESEETSLLMPKKLEYDLYSYKTSLGTGLGAVFEKDADGNFAPRYRTFYRNAGVGRTYFHQMPHVLGFTRPGTTDTWQSDPDQYGHEADDTNVHEVAHLKYDTGDEALVRHEAKYFEMTGKKPHPYMSSCSC